MMGRLVKLILFFILAGFIVYRFFLKKTLKHLDPSSVVPPRVKAALDSLAEPSDVRIKSYSSQGCLPSSAVNQPAVLAMKGKGTASRRIHCIHRAAKSRPPRRSNADTPMMAMKIVPSPTIM